MMWQELKCCFLMLAVEFLALVAVLEQFVVLLLLVPVLLVVALLVVAPLVDELILLLVPVVELVPLLAAPPIDPSAAVKCFSNQPILFEFVVYLVRSFFALQLIHPEQSLIYLIDYVIVPVH